jgi:methylated-DNA-[protein]-cysteine S-methyltransferase
MNAPSTYETSRAPAPPSAIAGRDDDAVLVMRTPFGELTLTERDGFLTEIRLPPAPSPYDPRRPRPHAVPTRLAHADQGKNPLLAETRRQLAEYFAGELRRFDLPVLLRGTAFQQRVWAELAAVAYGETISYGELARRVGAPDSARAVGQALGRNPVPIVVPCHRVVGARGELTGFGGGIELKRRLLHLEGWFSPEDPVAAPTGYSPRRRAM